MSCSACQSIFYATVKIAPQKSDKADTYFRPHHADISGLCKSALNGCRICTDLWRYYFKQKTPAQYADAPFFHNGEDFKQSTALHGHFHSGTSYRFREIPDHLARSLEGFEGMLLEFTANSPLEMDLKD